DVSVGCDPLAECVGADRGGCLCMFFFFFFQAEDGIRDFHVTGVQTCALPICKQWDCEAVTGALLRHVLDPEGTGQLPAPEVVERSEERRVGKECRSRWSPEH